MGSRQEPALADGRAAGRAEDSLRALRSPLPASSGVPAGVPAHPAPRWGHLRRGCRLRTRLQWSLVSWTRGAGQQRDALAQRCGERSACPRGAEARQVPRADPPRSTLRGSTPPGAPCPMARISGCETGPDPQPKSRRAVGSRGPERARSGGDHLAQQALAGCGAVGAPRGGTSKICAIATHKTTPKIAAATRRGGSSAAASKESGPSACVGRS